MFRPALALILTIAVFLLPSGASRSARDDCLIFGRVFEAKDIAGRILAENIMFALNAGGICVIARPLPGRRITQALLQGEIDGEFARVRAYLDRVGEAAFLIEEPVAQSKGYIVAKDPEVRSLGDLTKSRLGIVRGLVWQEQIAPAAQQVAYANSYVQLVEMFLNGRVDAILIDEHNLERFPVLGKWHMSEGTEFTAYVVLHKRQAAMRGRIVDAIQAYKSTGCVFEKHHGGPACGLRYSPVPNN